MSSDLVAAKGAATWSGYFAFIVLTMKYSKVNVIPSAQQLKLGQNWVVHHDTDCKHTSKSPTDNLERQKQKTKNKK